MSTLLGSMPNDLELCNFVNPIALLLDMGAEFANLSISRLLSRTWPSLPRRMTLFANSTEFVDCKVNSIRLVPPC